MLNSYGNPEALNLGQSISRGDDSQKKSFARNCDLHLKDRLFLFSFDLIDLNTFYNYFIYSVFLILDYVLIAYYPLNQMYQDFIIREHTQKVVTNSENGKTSNEDVVVEIKKYDKGFENENKDSYISDIVQYFGIDYFIDKVDFSLFIEIQAIVCHCLIIIFLLYLLMIITRQLGTINLSSQRKFITKLFAFVIVTITKTLQVPMLTFLFQIYSCNKNDVYIGERLDSGAVCYQGSHLNQAVYTSLVIFLYYLMVIFFHYFLTLSYPHEKIPWACLPTKIPILIEILKFFIILTYQETNISQYALSYLNIIYAAFWLLILYKRLFHVLIFHKTVYLITICGESCMFIIFGFSALRDFVALDRNFVLHIIWIGSCCAFALTALFLREKIRYKFLSKVDFALYEHDFDALIMMFTLHELIERSSYDDKEDFLLRGFIERHIEICEYPTCSCIKFYQICNQTYRLELAQLSPFSKNFDSGGSMSQSQTHQQTNLTFSQREQSDMDELSTLKVFYGSQKGQKKQNKSKAKFLKKFLIDNINVFLDVFPNSVKLHIMAAFIYFSIFKNSFKSLYELSFTKSIKSSLQDEYECFVLSSQIIAYFQSRASQGMSNQPVQLEKSKDDKIKKKGQEFNISNFEVESEIKQVIEFEKINIRFQKMIEQASIQTKDFWEEILKKNIDVKKIFELGAQIYKNFIEIKKKYKHLMNLNNNYLEVAYLYKLFVSLILNFEIEVEDAKLEIVKIMQSKSMRKHNLKTEFKTIQLLDENGMIIISGNTNNFSKILAMNNKAERIFGYSTNELIGSKLVRLMPKLFVDIHDSFILNFINGNRRINKENHSFIWGKHKSGFIIPIIMEINAYVNFEFNFCFIAFLKRSVLLEFKPLKELLEYQDVFVLQTNQNGIIQDMTQNMHEYLNFPIQALQKDISAEMFFKKIFDDENEQKFIETGDKIEFDPQVIRRLLEEEDIDIKDNDSDSGINLNSEKKCLAFVYLVVNEYEQQDARLIYKEVWFVLSDDDASFLDTKNTTEFMTNMGDDGPKVNVTYTDDREEICSIASVSSLANYDKNRKNILTKLSEIKTQTIDDSKPRQIDILQKAIIIVFLTVMSIALLLLIVSIDRNQGFFSNVEIIKKSKQSVIYFSELRTMLTTLVAFENSNYSFTQDPMLNNMSSFIIENVGNEIEQLRITQSYLNFVDFDYLEDTLNYKKSVIDDYYTIRSNNIIEKRSISFIQGVQEFLDITHDLAAYPQNFTFDTLILNYDNTNASSYRGEKLSNTAINLYLILKNGLGSLANYLFKMSERYIYDAVYKANNNESLVLILTIISITVTLFTAFVIIPILHKIERSKEKVLMIYTELKKEQIESLNRNIKVFFMKLQQSTNSLGGSLLYQNSSKQFSGKLITRKYTTAAGRKADHDQNDFGFLMRRPAIGMNEVENQDVDLEVTQNGQKNLKVHFPLLFNKEEAKRQQSLKVKKRRKSKVRKIGTQGEYVRADSQKKSRDDDSEEEKSEEDDDDETDQQVKEKKEDEEDSDLSDNAEEDKKAKMLMSREEAENALFKRIFQNKIKQMTCLRQVKYHILVITIALLMSGYFTLSYFMVTNIFSDSQQSLTTFDVVGNRGPYLDSLISYFFQTLSRNNEIYIIPPNSTDQYVNSIDYFYRITQQNEDEYNDLRRKMPSIIQGSKDLIEGLESQDMCKYLISDDITNQGERDVLIDQCKNVSSKILQLGMTQTINTLLQIMLQGTLQFRNGLQQKLDKEQQLFTIIFVKMKYLNSIDLKLLDSVEQSIIDYFTEQQRNYIIAFSVFIFFIIIAMILLSYNGVDYLFKNLVAIKFILNFIPGQWLLDNNAADDLKYIDF